MYNAISHVSSEAHNKASVQISSQKHSDKCGAQHVRCNS